MKRLTHTKGFTIVELLLIIAVVAILATIVIVSYNGAINRSKTSTVQSDLTQAYRQIEAEFSDEGLYPESGSTDFKESGTNALVYGVSTDRKAFCLQVSNNDSKYIISNTNTSSRVGYCSTYIGIDGLEPADESMTASTFLGSGIAGYTNATGTAARFDLPSGLVIAPNGNFYIADMDNDRIRMATPAGVVTLYAGSGTHGYSNSTLTASRFSYPQDIVADTSGNLFVADLSNHAIRKITPSAVTTFAGSSGGTAGSTDGTGTAARFNTPLGLAIDASNTIYVADSVNNKIRKITSAGVVTTLAGSGSAGSLDGTGTAAQFNFPSAITVDSSGNLYVADASNNKIRKITSAGVVTTLAGTGSPGYVDGPGITAQFNAPAGIAVNVAGTSIYVSDSGNHRIRKVSSGGTVTSIAGSGVAGFADGFGVAAQFNNPRNLYISSAGILYVADQSNHRIRIVQN